MSVFSGVFTTTGTTGNRSLTGIGFQPNYIRLTLSQKTSTSETFSHFSEGYGDGTNQGVNSVFYDSTGGKSVESTSRCINHMNRVSGTITDVIKATLVSFDADGFTLNFSSTISGYHVHVEAFN